ncbi:winged helix-turn-helix transcriptional regulator [Trabulsiella odontotermitis]|uniref:winged helix-turn-helix transcriptional regulator n=1 Tax=Trabulsiella odontotermitis TaxID=379893 RepID=UPI00192D60A1|nr:helix-turn-helix domain-containing protein [Trabulsiella odontotermitis]
MPYTPTDRSRDVFFADCAARSFFDQVASKWSVMILIILEERPTRFNEMMRRMEGITHKALTQALRRLERNGLISRKVLSMSPVAVEYSITELGKTLQKPFSAVYEWSILHLEQIEITTTEIHVDRRNKSPMRANYSQKPALLNAEVSGPHEKCLSGYVIPPCFNRGSLPGLLAHFKINSYEDFLKTTPFTKDIFIID